MCNRPSAGYKCRLTEIHRSVQRRYVFSEVHGFSDWKNVLPFFAAKMCCLYYCSMKLSVGILNCIVGQVQGKRCSETKSTELFPQRLTVEKVPRIVGNWKVHYCIHKSLPPIPILSHIYPICASPPLFLEIHFNIILQSVPVSSWFSPSGSTTKTMYARLLYPVVAICPTHLDAQKVHSVNISSARICCRLQLKCDGTW